MGNIFYMPQDGIVADIIPFYDRGEFYLFYLHDYRDPEGHGEGTPWKLVTTGDLVSFAEWGEVIPRGNKDEQDLYVFTGSVLKRTEGEYFLFYTGHNPHFNGRPKEKILLARSSDLLSWKKQQDFSLSAPQGYEGDDWRDPFVFFDADEGNYKMLLTARVQGGSQNRNGCTAMARSQDLLHWEIVDPLWAPEAYCAHECPDLFQMGGLWYLIFSEFSDKRCTQYRVSETPAGPWRLPDRGDGLFDGRAFYAAKTASDGQKRYVFGWIPTKEGDDDDLPWRWGGSMVAHEVRQGADGALECYLPQQVKARFCRTLYHADTIALGRDGMALHEMGPLPSETYLISTDVTADERVSRFGVCLREGKDADERYVYLFDLREGRASFTPIPQKPWKYADFVGVERKMDFAPGRTYHMDLVVDGDACVLYCEGLALSSRMGQRKGCPWSLLSVDGETRFENLCVKTVGDEP